MRILILASAMLLLAACEVRPHKQPKPKYKEGDVVWLKPDSTKATIVNVRSACGCGYDVSYFDNDHKAHEARVREFEIFSVVNQ